MNIREEYKKWLEKVQNSELFEELKRMNPDSIAESFGGDLTFGTGGLRGKIGAGKNRMNIYTVGRATQGLCNYLKCLPCKTLSVAIAYDSRMKSEEFAKTAATVFAGNGIKAYIFKELEPTPVLSFAVRRLCCIAGIVITASHNPAEYNGYKVYNSDGCQITPETARRIQDKISSADEFSDVRMIEFDKALSEGMVSYVGDNVLKDYFQCVKLCAINEDACAKAVLKVVYSPLNGTGNKPVRTVLSEIGLKNVAIVPSQELPDGKFTTCKKPNPEEREAFSEALKLAHETGADLILATDPDCDRVGVAVMNDGEYKLLTGNETGCLLLYYILSQRKAKGTLPKNPVVIKTIVTSNLAKKIAMDFSAEVIETLTGFKFIGEQIGVLESKGRADDFVFGFEESYGCLSAPYVRDKDAVSASMLICEMASFYKMQGKNLIKVLDSLYLRYGAYKHRLLSFAFEGLNGMRQMNDVMDRLRADRTFFAGYRLLSIADYNSSVLFNSLTGNEEKLDLPKSNVIAFSLEDGLEAVVRPSGTEPKLKCYLTALGANETDAERTVDTFENAVREYLLQKDFKSGLGKY